MRNVSEQFKEALGELVRPATRLHFEICSNVSNGVYPAYDSEAPTEDYGFDTFHAPIVRTNSCAGENFYAIAGDDIGVDDPNRICTPADPETMPVGVSVPFGMTPYVVNESSVLIGGSAAYNNWNIYAESDGSVTLYFKGTIPDHIDVERYDSENDSWYVDATVYDTDGDGKFIYVPTSTPEAGDFTRFRLYSGESEGRFQLLWAQEAEKSPLVFDDELISNIDISEETDLTSQTLPSYEMTVECLDVDEIYKPDTSYWEDYFWEGAYCYLAIGYEFDGVTEYIPFFSGYLTKAPDYSEGKLTFNITAMLNEGTWTFNSLPDKTLNTGDEVKGEGFGDVLDRSPLFDSYDIFINATDKSASKTNFYGSHSFGETRQLIANALGGYITAGVDTVDLHSTNDIQYKPFADYMTRYEQIQNTLESQPKVGEIAVTRNQNTVSTDSVQRTPSERSYIHADETIYITYNVPFFAISKFIVNDYQKSVPSAAVQADYNTANFQEMKPDGTVDVNISFWADTNTYIQPIVTFYGVKNEKFTETEELYDNGEKYENDNELITNSYITEKVKRVARMINGIPNKYEVDVVQDYRYELGDIIRLETQKGIFKTCVITGLNFKLPGSSGHLTCRKIFSLLDSSFAVIGAEGLTIDVGNTFHFKILETSESGIVIGKFDTDDYTHFYMLGVSKYEENGVEKTADSELMDLNGHIWLFVYRRFTLGMSIETNAPIIELPQYEQALSVDEATFGAVNMIKKIYEDQGMTAPVDYTCILD